MKKLAMGYRVVDYITGFTGKVTGVVEYLTGCKQYLVQPIVGSDGRFEEARWFDEDRLSVVKEEKPKRVNRKGFGPAAPSK